MFITNQGEDCTLQRRLSELMQFSSQLDILVGFFYFSGVKVMTEPLRQNKDIRLRVLVGMEAERYCGQLVEIAQGISGESDNDVRTRFYASLRRILGDAKLDQQSFHERLEVFIELLTEGRLEIRKTREPNHAKLYIFSMDEQHKQLREKAWLTGSSNFSEPGLSTRDELNVEIADFGAEEASTYYEHLWMDAIPLTEDEEQRKILLEIIRDSSVAATVIPFEAYYLVLKHYLEHQQSRLKMAMLEGILNKAGFSKLRYQVDAVAQAMNKIEAYHGVIIADVVGLGKSVIGSLLAAMSRKRGLIICPPGLVGERGGAHGGWHEYVTKFGLHDWEVFSRGDLEKVENFLTRDPDFDMVIVDEAHYYRNESTEAYARMKNICSNKDVVLLTATPFNNRPADLLALLHLFSSGKQSPFVPGGNLDGRFAKFKTDFENVTRVRKFIAKNDWESARHLLEICGVSTQRLNQGANHEGILQALRDVSEEVAQGIRQVMEKIVIRRNRLDLRQDPDYSHEISTLSNVRPPVQQFFELTPEQDAFYERVVHDYFGPDGRFHGAFYRPQAYVLNKEGLDDYQDNIYTMLLRMLALRFESSFGAFRQSIENAKNMMERAERIIGRFGVYIYDRKITEKVMEVEDDVDAYEILLKQLEQQGNKTGKRKSKHEAEYRLSDRNFDGKRFMADLKSDIALMKAVLEEVDALKLVRNDPKATALAKTITAIVKGQHAEIAAEDTKRKVLVFTAYTDTLKHISAYVEQECLGRVLTVDSGSYTQEKDRLVKANFDASAEVQEDDYDILLTTDKLSEGFNLNRAGAVVNYDIPWNPTRVIQRVGRINRIGKKVFDDLYILNFFPTLRGASINQNKEMAQSKMFAIHSILGEDSQIFSEEETPSPAALFSKLNSSLDEQETISTYTDIKLKFQAATKMLQKKHPEVLERIKRLPNMVKTAMLAEPHATLMFRRRGPGFFALQHTAGREISEIPMEQAVKLIECDFDTPRAPLSHDFWVYPNEQDTENGQRRQKDGIYSDLKAYQPAVQPPQRGGVSDATQAIVKLEQCKEELPHELKQFANDVIEDIQHFGALPRLTIKRIAEAETPEAVQDILLRVARVRGYDYVQKLRDRALTEEIVVTVQRN